METEAIIQFFQDLQDAICGGLEKLEPEARFQEDLWQRPGGGGGRTRVISGAVLAKGGVNFSDVHGTLNEASASSLGTVPGDFRASGVSIVLHPQNPWVPIIHMNVRFFELGEGREWWFGGGIDLTPHFILPEDAAFFHQHLKKVCDQFDPAYYPEFKNWADDYFYLPHRQETRGIGGIFFDRLQASDRHDRNDRFEFVKAVGEAFVPIYTELVLRNRDRAYGEAELAWQRIRRGRYVEFNLVWDRGTKFGLQTNGRTESILMSLPPQANWAYDYQPEPDTEAHRTQEWLKKGVDWHSR
jgi:coproporphyrinogen III oxidase